MRRRPLYRGLYDETDLERFTRILRLCSLGFSLHGITEMMKRSLEETGTTNRRRYSDASRCKTFLEPVTIF